MNKGDIVEVTLPPVQMQLNSKGNLDILDTKVFRDQLVELFRHGLKQENVKKKDVKFIR